jgi:hypothetical protein
MKLLTRRTWQLYRTWQAACGLLLAVGLFLGTLFVLDHEHRLELLSSDLTQARQSHATMMREYRLRLSTLEAGRGAPSCPPSGQPLDGSRPWIIPLDAQLLHN